MEEYLNRIKKNLKEENYETLEELIKLEMNPNGKLKRLCNLTKEDYELMLKIITHDEEIYKELEKLKQLKKLKEKKEDLETIKENIEETKNKIKQETENLKITTKTKTNIPILKQIRKKQLENKNKEILSVKFKKIIELIEQSKLKRENKELKQTYLEKEETKETLDKLHKQCELEKIEEVIITSKELDNKYENILKKIEKDLEKEKNNYQEKIKRINNYDKRLIEYTFNKKNNYITLAIEHLSKEKIKLNNNNIEIEKLNHELLIYALISLYKINNNQTKITIIEQTEKPIQKTKKK